MYVQVCVLDRFRHILHFSVHLDFKDREQWNLDIFLFTLLQIILLPLLYKTTKPRTATNKKNPFHLQSARSNFLNNRRKRLEEDPMSTKTLGATKLGADLRCHLGANPGELKRGRNGQGRSGHHQAQTLLPTRLRPTAEVRGCHPGLQTATKLTPHPADKTSYSSCWRRARCAQAAQGVGLRPGVRPGLFLETPRDFTWRRTRPPELT